MKKHKHRVDRTDAQQTPAATPNALGQPTDDLWSAAKTAVQISGLGFYLVAVVGVCVYLGMLADDYFALDGKGRLAGILAGFPIAIYSLWKNFRQTLSK